MALVFCNTYISTYNAVAFLCSVCRSQRINRLTHLPLPVNTLSQLQVHAMKVNLPCPFVITCCCPVSLSRIIECQEFSPLSINPYFQSSYPCSSISYLQVCPTIYISLCRESLILGLTPLNAFKFQVRTKSLDFNHIVSKRVEVLLGA